MKKFQLVFVVLIFLTQIVKSQKINFSLERPDLQKLDSLESAQEGKRMTFRSNVSFRVSKNYFPNSDSFNLGQPITYTRETQLLSTFVQYFYSTPDSVVRLIEYSWDATEHKISQLNKLYEYNAEQFSKMLGNKGVNETENHEDWTQTSTIWENDLVHVKQFMVTGSRTYRVRVLMSWK